jgi:hypothetical protein
MLPLRPILFNGLPLLVDNGTRGITSINSQRDSMFRFLNTLLFVSPSSSCIGTLWSSAWSVVNPGV